MKICLLFPKQIYKNGLAFTLTCIFIVGFTPDIVFPQASDTPPYGMTKESWIKQHERPASNLKQNNYPMSQENSVFINGSFESGDFSGWITQDMFSPFFPLQVGGAGISSWSGFFLSDPTDGSHAALHGFDGEGPDTIRIAQDVSLPAEALFLEFDFRGAWDLVNYNATQNRIFMINIEPGGGGTPLKTDTILVANVGTLVPDTGELHGSLDVSGFANSLVRISFDWFIPETFTGPGFFQLDNVFIIPIGSGPQISLSPPSIDFGNVGVGNSSSPSVVTIRSLGTDILTVSAILSPGLPFTLGNVPPLPVSIPPGGTETFEVTFSPQNEGTFNASITVSSDDPDDPTKDISLSGEGLVINPVLPEVFYASTGNIDGGRIITIDLNTGSGTLIGSTGLSAVPGLAIDSDGYIYGVEASTSSLYQIDATTGAAVFVASTGLSSLPAIAFDGNDVLYGLGVDPLNFNFNLYTINTSTGIPTLIGPAGSASWRGMAFNPIDGTLWASTSWEDIYVIDPETGTATFIGNTNLSMGMPDIQFDEQGILYGAAGGGSQTSDLVSIDQTTGTGTLIGSTGFSSVSGMATRIQKLIGPHIGIFPISNDFGKVPVNTSSAPRTITIRSIGSDTLTVSVISEPGSPFTLSNIPSLPAVIPPGGMETFEVTFSPTSVGIFNAAITITSNDPDNPTKDISLVGEGLDVNPASPGMMYASTGNIDGGRLITVDLNSGVGSVVGPTGLDAVPGLAINSSGDIYGIDASSSALYLIDASTGGAAFVAGTGLASLPAIAFDGNDVMYGLGVDPLNFNFNLYKINTSTGTPTLIGPAGFASWRGMAFSPIDGTLWASTSGEDIYIIDPETGTTTFIGNTDLSMGMPDIQFDKQGILYGAAGGGSQTTSLISIDQTTGSGTIIGSTGFSSVSGMAMRIQPLAGPHIGIVPVSINFGKVLVNSSSAPRTITIRSIGSDTLTISGISDPGMPFILMNVPSFPLALPPGALETIDVTFSPVGVSTFSATITITSNDSDDTSKDISLIGEGLIINPAPPGTMYATTGNMDGGRLISIDLDTGSGTLVGPTGLDAVPGLAVNSSGYIYGLEANTRNLYQIDASAGTAVFVAGTGLVSLPAIAFDGTDVLYGLGIDPVNFNFNLYTINTNTGVPTLIGPAGSANWRGMTFNPIDGTLWASTNGDEIYRIDPKTGLATFIGTTGLFTGMPDIQFDEQGVLYGAAGGGGQVSNLVLIDQTTGVGTIIGSIGFSSVSGMAMQIQRLIGPHIGVFPINVNFGKVLVDSVGVSRTFTIRSIGTDTLTVSGISDPGTPFTLSGVPSLPVIIPPNGAEIIEVTFSPISTGMFNAAITITSDDPDNPTKDVSLSGEGLLPPSPGTLFGSTAGNETLVMIDPSTGNATPVGSTAGFGGITEVEFRKDGVLFGSTGGGSSNIIVINILTGEPTLLGQHIGGAVNGMEFSPGGTLFGTFITAPNTSSSFVSIDQTSGALTFIGTTGLDNIGGLAFDSDGILYGVTSGSSGGDLVTIDTLTGAASLVGFSGFLSVGSLEFSPNGVLYAGLGQNDPTNPGSLITIDEKTGIGTLVGASGFSTLSGLSFYPDVISSIDNFKEVKTPTTFDLSQNYPNPFNPVTHIKFTIPHISKVRIEIFNVQGQQVATLIDERKEAGYYQIDFDGSGFASGLYFYRIQTEDFGAVKKMILIK